MRVRVFLAILRADQRHKPPPVRLCFVGAVHNVGHDALGECFLDEVEREFPRCLLGAIVALSSTATP